MKQIITLAIFTLCYLYSYSQFNIGDHAGTIIQDAEGRKTDWGKIGEHDVLTVHYTYSDLSYVVNENMICFAAFIIPFTSMSDNSAAEMFNKKWTIVSSTVWRSYSGSKILKAERQITNEGKAYYFISIDN